MEDAENEIFNQLKLKNPNMDLIYYHINTTFYLIVKSIFMESAIIVHAVINDKVDIVKYYLEIGFDVNFNFSANFSANYSLLAEAIHSNVSNEMIKLLLDFGADIQYCYTEYNLPPLLLAVHFSHEHKSSRIVDCMLDYGAISM